MDLQFQCDDCNLQFSSLKAFTSHRRLHVTRSAALHKEKDILQGVCPFCCLTFYFKSLVPDCLDEVMRLQEETKKGTRAKKLLECRYCMMCKTSFRNSNEFLSHSKAVHNLDRPYQCQKCNFNSFRYHDLKRHSYVHENIKLYQCHLCPKEYTTKTSLDYHLLTHSSVKMKSHDCEFCGKKFPIPHLLKRHMKTHVPVAKIFKCDLCPKQFAYKHSLKLHNLIHTGERPYRCPICQRGFTQPFNYRRHMQGHNQIIGKVINCKQCEKQFLTPYLLKRHMLTHSTSTRPFCCDICSKPFAREDGLNLHRRTHTGNLPYTCEDCGKKFTRCSNYKRHRVIHIKPNQDPVSCKHCGKSFPAMYRLERHLRIHTRLVDKPHKCPVCLKEFTSKPDFKNHLLIHQGKEPFSCMHCGKRFVKQRYLKIHLDPDKEAHKLLKCRKCKCTFSNRNCFTFHNRTHKKEFFCDICQRKFYSPDGFKKHLRRHVKDEKMPSCDMAIKEEI